MAGEGPSMVCGRTNPSSQKYALLSPHYNFPVLMKAFAAFPGPNLLIVVNRVASVVKNLYERKLIHIVYLGHFLQFFSVLKCL